MKALVLKGLSDAEVVDVPIPEINDTEVLVKVDSCSICGTDIRTYKFGHPRIHEPRIIGHEFSGTIAKIGSSVNDYKQGGRVIVVPGISCGQCYFCRHGLENLCDNRAIIGFDFDGGFAEYVKIPSMAIKMGNLKVIPDKLSLKEACLVEPFTAVYNGQNLLGITVGSSVAIVGGGPIGLMHAMQARFRGASEIALFDVSEQRCELASQFDLDYVINSKENDPIQKTMEITNRRGFDVVIVACGSAVAQAQALQMARKNGRVSFFAGLPHGRSDVTIDSNLIHYKQLGVFGANGSGANEYEETVSFLGVGLINLSRIISTELPLKSVLKGFEIVQSASALKVIVHP